MARWKFTIENFWKRYQPIPFSGCWIWEGPVDKDGYGTTSNGIRAHRFSYEITHGNIPKGMNVLHVCDIPSCMNPNHLFLGTIQDNVDDKMKKSRYRSRTKLTTNDVREILTLKSKGETYKNISIKFKLTPERICQICNGKHIKTLVPNCRDSSLSI